MELNLDNYERIGKNLKLIEQGDLLIIIVDKTAELAPPKPGKKMSALASSGGFQWITDEFKANIYIGK
jgi:hypothetical protein